MANYNLPVFSRLVDDAQLWSPASVKSADVWIRRIVEKLFESTPKMRLQSFKTSSVLGRHLMRLCRLQPTFCGDVFPLLVHDLLLRHFSGVQVRNILSSHFNSFFENHFRSVDAPKSEKNDYEFNFLA